MQPNTKRLIVAALLVLFLAVPLLMGGLSEVGAIDTKIYCNYNPSCIFSVNSGMIIYATILLAMGAISVWIHGKDKAYEKEMASLPKTEQRNREIRDIFSILIAITFLGGLTLLIPLHAIGFLTTEAELFGALIGLVVTLLILLGVYRLLVGPKFDKFKW